MKKRYLFLLLVLALTLIASTALAGPVPEKVDLELMGVEWYEYDADFYGYWYTCSGNTGLTINGRSDHTFSARYDKNGNLMKYEGNFSGYPDWDNNGVTNTVSLHIWYKADHSIDEVYMYRGWEGGHYESDGTWVGSAGSYGNCGYEWSKSTGKWSIMWDYRDNGDPFDPNAYWAELGGFNPKDYVIQTSTGGGSTEICDHETLNIIDNGDRTHRYVCADCGEVIDINKHFFGCTDPNHCEDCGAEAEEGDSVTHWHRTVEYDKVTHTITCNDCGQVWHGPHETFEGDPEGFCSICGGDYTPQPKPAFSLNSLTTDVATAAVGQQITVTANMTAPEAVLEMEYHVYNQLGQHISGWNGISGVYYYTATEPGAYTFRVYVRTADGWVNVDSKPVTVTATAKPLKAVALKASGTTAKVGDTLTFTTQFEGEGEIAWIEYHIYDTQGQHLTGYRGEGAGISGVYNYPTANTGAGKYTARVYLMAKDGTFTTVDSVQVTVTAGTRKAVALRPNSTTAKVGDTLVFTTQFEGDGPIAWIEYHIYDTYGNHLTGYRGEGSGISGVYNYPTASTGAGKYTARVYLMAQDGTFTQVDSAQVTVE